MLAVAERCLLKTSLCTIAIEMDEDHTVESAATRNATCMRRSTLDKTPNRSESADVCIMPRFGPRYFVSTEAGAYVAFGDHISHVVTWSAQEQMIWTNAQADVAFMENL